MNLISWLKEVAGSFQPAYDKIKAWKLTPAQEALLDSIWKNLSPALQKTLWAFVALIFTKYGPDAAKKILESILSGIKREGWVIES